ncbi:MAG TPA: hypothetical protein VKE41_18040, partial [Roseiflexaceae bacterium]|nr:hypothetical protein [Roseiflexaceae bacterium]
AEPQPVVAHERAAADTEQPSAAPILPIIIDSDDQESVAAQAASLAPEQALAPSEQEPTQEIAAFDTEAVASVDVSAVELSTSERLDEESPLESVEDQPPIALAEPEAAPIVNVEVSTQLIDPLAAIEEEPAELTVAAAVGAPIEDAPAGDEGDQVAEPLDAPAAPGEQRPAGPTGTAAAAQPTQSLNGTSHKPKSGRGSRRQQSANQPAASQPAKRRSSGSKRKQTG